MASIDWTGDALKYVKTEFKSTCQQHLEDIERENSLMARKLLEKMKTNAIKKLIKIYNELASQKPTVFLNHVDYFQNYDGIINVQSISKKWSALTKENSYATQAKGNITIREANSHPINKGCPYINEFNSSKEIMPCLKHSRDTGIVNKNGSINESALEYVMNTYFEEYKESPEFSKLILKQSKMSKYLKECNKRDEHLPSTAAYFIPYKFLASEEWRVFFETFSDVNVDGELAVTAETFLLFYYDGKTLYDRILNKNK